MYRVVFDTNVFLSAFVFGGNPQKLFESARKKHFQLLISPSILFEFVTILRTKFSWDDTDITLAIRTVVHCSESIKPAKKIELLSDDPDNRILECAVEGQADYIASGDHHLIELGQYLAVKILSPRELIEMLGEDPY